MKRQLDEDPYEDALAARDRAIAHVMSACDREIKRARSEGNRLANACDIARGYEPNLKAIKSTLRELVAAEMKLIAVEHEVLNALPR